MDNNPQPPQPEEPAGAPPPEVLSPRSDGGATGSPTPPPAPGGPPDDKKKRRRTYRPSHRATFISVLVVVVILIINAGIIGLVLKHKSGDDSANRNQVTISSDVLDKLGVSKTPIGSAGTKLTIGPDTQFNGKIKVAGDAAFSGQLTLNNKISGTNASFTQLQAGNTSFTQINVNGDGSFNNLNLRDQLTVVGKTNLQGAVTIDQLLTLTKNLNVAGNLAVGGTLSAGSFSARNLVSTGTLTVGGHIITSGATPSIGPGVALGSNGTATISGNDSAGTISIGIGVGATGGTLFHVAFHSQYAASPKVVITPVGVAGEFYVTNISTSGFSVGVGSGLSPGGYGINYLVEQ